MFEKIDQYNPSYLLEDAFGAVVIAAPLKPGQGTLSRGQILKRASDGMFVAAGTSDITTSNFLAILDEEINTSENMLVSVDARAYTAGHFIESKLILTSSGVLTAAHKLVLRIQGIFTGILMDDAADFENGYYAITYKANNDVTPAEADVAQYALKGSTYTIVGNDTTAFTAPSGKSFSKWNTKADGTGTDYAAAASYTAAAALTLYAIWA